MGSRDDNLSDQELAEEARLRQALGRWGEPALAAPPPDLALRALAALQLEPDGARHGPPWRRSLALAGLALALLLVALGAWAVLLPGGAPRAGGPAEPLLLLALAAKPLINLLLAAGPVALLGAAAAAAAASLWWRLARVAPGARP